MEFSIAYLGRLIVFICVLLLPINANATTAIPGISVNSSTEVNPLPKELTPQAVSAYLATLSDKEVRTILNKQLQGLAATEQTTKTDLRASIRETIIKTRQTIWQNLKKSLDIGGAFVFLYQQFSIEQFGDYFLWNLLLKICMAIAIAYALEWIIFKFIYRHFGIKERIKAGGFSVSQQLLMLSKILLLRAAGLVVFYSIAEELISWFSVYEIESNISDMVFDYIFVARLVFLFSAFFFSPNHTELRLFKITDKQAKYFVNRQLVVCIFASSSIFLGWTREMGVDNGAYRLGFVFNALFYTSLLWVVWSCRQIITDMLLHIKAEISPTRRRFALMWPKIMMSVIVFVWVLFEAIVANHHYDNDLALGATFSILTVISVPFFDIAILALIEHYYPVGELVDERMAKIRSSLQTSLIRIIRLVLFAIIVILYPIFWGFSYADLASQGFGAKATTAVIEVFSIVLGAYILWEILNAYVKRKLMLEAPEEQEEADEGGQGLTRVATVLPIIHVTVSVFIIVFTLFAVLTTLGFNTTPLLAGAGVLGLAVGFGAQTLVKDIVSGVFFLVDDALRMGEYVNTGEIKGTVEKIALRSLRLRHHLGALHTIPYGEIARLTNYSRDWAIMKLRFQVPHDTDINKIKKLFKNLGKELLEHPELGQDFIQPFKSQGVLEVDEVGMVIRGKFTCKPGRQFMIRKEVYIQVQRLFAENGIEFARRKVEVQIPDSTPENMKQQVSAVAGEAVTQATQEPALPRS